MTSLRTLLAAAAILTLSSCAFSRIVINEGVEDLDPSSIEAGKTDRLGVALAIGLPPPEVPEEIGTYGVSRDYLNYVTVDVRCVTIGPEIGIVAPFRWCSSVKSYELAIEFDDAGLVRGVYETRRRATWPFFGDDRGAVETVVLSDRLQP